MNITTKYNIGDKVWIGRTHWQDKSIVCPECVNGFIKLRLKSGQENHAKCPVCYGRGRDARWDFYASVEEFTIGSVRYDSAASPEEQFSYMCVETGVGSGSIWYEPNIFTTKEGAEQYAACATERARESQRIQYEQQKQHDKENY